MPETTQKDTISPTHQLAPEFVQQHLESLRNPRYSENEIEHQTQRIRSLLERENAVLVAHYYTDSEIQKLAEETGGCVADSLQMAQFGARHEADTLVVAGVRFMGETAKILTPEKRVLMPTLDAECSLDLGCPPAAFKSFCDQHPDRTVIVYANTSAEVKAQADWVVTSSIALRLVEELSLDGERILWAPDRHLGGYIQRETGADMVLWDSACIVHEEFKSHALITMKEQMPDAGVLVHPEAPHNVIVLADAVGSTSQLIAAAQHLPHSRFIVATDAGIFYKMRMAAPDKEFFAAPTFGNGASCQACSKCPWMALNTLETLANGLDRGDNEIKIDPELGKRALRPLQRMLAFAEDLDLRVTGKECKNL